LGLEEVDMKTQSNVRLAAAVFKSAGKAAYGPISVSKPPTT
jgi:hypothetical protein